MTRTTSGTIAMIGGAAYTISGIRMLIVGEVQNVVSDSLGLVWAVCWVVGGIAMVQLRITGNSVAARMTTLIPVVGFALAAFWAAYRLVDPTAADESVLSTAPFFVIFGMLLVGLLAPFAKVLEGWRRYLPLVIALTYITTVVYSIQTGASTLGIAFTIAGLCYVLLGRAIRGESLRFSVEL